MADDYGSYPVKKLQERNMKVPGKQGGNSDIFAKTPPPVGAQRNPGASPDDMFGREFSAEKDLRIIIAANKIRANKARLGAALSLGRSHMAKDASGKDRAHTLAGSIKDRGSEPLNERKGADNKGIRTRSNNSYDNRAPASKPNTGTRMDGQKARW